MATSAATLRVGNLESRQLSALKRKAQRMGLTPATYVKLLIEDDLALDEKARTTSLDELAAPFRKALAGVPEHELDRIVHAARARTNGASSRRGR